MKNDPFFKYLAAIVIAGVFIAVLSPSHRNLASPAPITANVTQHVPDQVTEAAQ